MSAERVFQTLLFCGLIAGGWLYGNYWKNNGNTGSNDDSLAAIRAQNTELTSELDTLRGELAQVRSLLKDGPYPVPDDLIKWVETDNGLVFLEKPNVGLASPAEIRTVAERNLDLAYGKDGLETDQRAWELIGLIPPNQNLRGQWIVIETVGAKGIFDIASGKILLAETFDPVSVPHTAFLAHLLTRQLLFQNFPQKQWRDTDAWRAWQAIHRGAAGSVQARFLRRNTAQDQVEWKDDDQEREEILLQLPPIMQGLANFPYIDGNAFTKKAYLDSRDAYRDLFKSPPLATQEILYPSDTQPNAPTSTTRLGALGLRLHLDPLLGNEASNPIASQLLTDAYFFQDQTLIWTIQMATPEAAAAIAPALQDNGPGQRQVTIQDSTITLRVTPTP